MLAGHFGIEAIVEDIAPALEGLGCYWRQVEAIRTVVPGYGDGWKCKLVLPSILESDRLNITQLTVQSPAGERECAYLTLVRWARSLAAQGLETHFRLNYAFYRPGRESMMPVRSTVLAEFRQVASEQNKKLAALADDLVLLESGLDSLCFAIIVARLEDTLGVDPFTSTEKAAFPVTLGDFIKFYEDAVK